ncbi:MAG: hypothetical protein WAN93_12010 [Solirubrobacteraceae bacterium]
MRWGRVTPFFCKHSRIAAKRAGPRALPVVGVFAPVDGALVEVVPAPLVEVVPVEAPVEAALVLEDVLLEEPPHAARPTQASNRISRAAAAGLRPLVLV